MSGRPHRPAGSGRGRGARSQPAETEGLGGAQVEGRQAVRELLRAGNRAVRQVAMAASAAGGRLDDGLAEIEDLATSRGVALRWVSREQLWSMAGTDAPQGVVALAEPVSDHTLEELAGGPVDGPAFLVVLDGVTDPHNLGAVMRSALCAGATGLVVARRRAAHLTPAAVKAAAGAVEHLPVATVAGVPSALSDLDDAGVWTVGLDSDGPTTLWELGVATEPVALVLGAEGRGLSPLARKRCQVVASVPMSGPLGSLNVSAAAALACFEVARRRSQA